MPNANSTLLSLARQRFFDRGELPAGSVPDAILRSWQRSSMLIRTTVPDPVLTKLQLREHQERHTALCRAIQPVQERLMAEVLQFGGMVALAAPDGLILDTAGDLAFLSNANRVALKPGNNWSEASKGTNAIGTALAERSAIVVSGAEHYLDSNRILSCTATPLLGADGNLAGVLDISCKAGRLPAGMPSMLRLAAGLVEYQLLVESAGPLPRLHFRCPSPLSGSYREGVLVIDNDHIIHANDSALHLLATQRTQLIGSSLTDWFCKPPASHRGSQSQTFHTHTGLALIGHWVNAPPRITTANLKPTHTTLNPLKLLLDKGVRVFNTGLSILLQGETGVGKEVFARQLHTASQRQQGPFVAVNCAALPENLIESELFGYEEGAFSGARKRGMPGRVREAVGGVLFLDEIGDMPLALQARLLRVLQDKTVTPLGGGKTVRVDFGLICATHRNLNELVATGQFRADLLFRLREFDIELPSLRLRDDKAKLLDELFTKLGGTANGLQLDLAARQALLQHAWPGNIRELVSTLRTLIALADPGSTLTIADLPATIRPEVQPTQNLTALTHDAIATALANHKGGVNAAAKQLGIHRSTLYRYLARNDTNTS
ncbi:sigma-54-dependent Fis family transcriptional regulator [Chitinimonas sp. PSY-7]|uniref:sigma 54-interacting transcriptional regulator n=1 Tax=Chitinimonas sp. PSY-7 TaxID=3459088 RepID=UPI00403FCBF1